jgi:hypothetical protein
MPLNTAASQWSARSWADAVEAVEKAAAKLNEAEAAAVASVAEARADYVSACNIERSWREDLQKMMAGVASSYT